MYSLANCTTNAWNLVRRFEKHGVDLSNARVLYIPRVKEFSEDRGGFKLASLHPLKARFGIGPVAWPFVFHVVVDYRGVVLDFDLTKRSRPLPALQLMLQSI